MKNGPGPIKRPLTKNESKPKLTPAKRPMPAPHRKPTIHIGIVEPRVIEPPIGALKIVNPERTNAIATNKAASMYGRIRRFPEVRIIMTLYNKKGAIRTTAQTSSNNTLLNTSKP